MFRIIKSTAFRFTLLYITLFAISTAAVLTFAYQATIQDLEGQIKNVVNGQIGKIKQSLVDGGPDEAAKTINQLIAEDIDRMSFFMLINPNWDVVAGNIISWPGGSTDKERWITFIPKVEYQNGTIWVPALARTVTLPGNYLLTVGYNLWHLERLRAGITRVLTYTVCIVLGVGIIGGMLLTHIVKKRVEALNEACRHVMSGRLDERVAVTGSGDEFDMLSTNFNAMMMRIAELVDGIRTVSHNIAHDLRTPLNRVRNKLEGLIVTHPEPQKCYEKLREVTKDIDSLVATFNAILSISEAEHGTGTELFAEFDISKAISDVCDFYSLVAEEKRIALKATVEPGIKLHGNRHLVSQAVANLLDNGIKYTPEGGEISVSLEKVASKEFGVQSSEFRENAGNWELGTDSLPIIILSVVDTGPGIPEEYREKVKQRFYRMEKSRSTKGSGLGLSLVNAVAKLHHGSFVISDSPLSSGLMAQIKIPAAV